MKDRRRDAGRRKPLAQSAPATAASRTSPSRSNTISSSAPRRTIPWTGSKILVDFREQGGALTGWLFPSGTLVDTIKMEDGTTIDVKITDMVNPCVFFKAPYFGLGLTGLDIPNPGWPLNGPPGAQDRLAETAPEGGLI
jgi:2-methylaconitate cis-trans-isomerase PrpF